MNKITKLFSLIGIIAVSEFLITVFMPILGVPAGFWEVMLDVLLLSAVVAPFMYKFVKAEAALSERARHAALSAEVGAALVKGATLRDALQGCCEAMARHLDAAFARIWTLNDEEDTLELQASAGMYTHIDGAHSRVPVGKYKIGLIAEERKPHLTNSVIGDPRVHNQEWARREGMVAFAGYPLIIDDRVVGVAAMFARKPLSETTMKALGSVADEVALGIERIRTTEALTASEERFRGLVEESLVGAYIIQDGRVRYANRRMAEIYGYMTEEFANITAADLVYPDDLAMEEGLNLRLISGEADSVHYEARRMRKDGGVIHVEMHRWMTQFEGRPAVIGTALDVTERKKLERERADFYAMVTHDLRSPLTAVQGYADIIVNYKSDMLDKEALEMVSAILQNSEKIKSIVEDFLLQSKLESGAGALKKQPVDVAGLLLEIKDEFMPQVQKAGLVFDVAAEEGLPDPPLCKTLVARAVSNLVQNAINYTPTGGSVTLKAEHAEAGEGGFTVISVSDTGPGIPEDELCRIFEKYYRSPRTTGVKGTGLGLAIVKSVAEAHGGMVEALCPEGEGCTFKLFLPETGAPVYPRKDKF